MSLARADKPIADVIAFFAEYGLEVGLLVPTATGLDKSIMDAHGSLRDYLAFRGVHDYASQAQGPEAKKVLPAWFVTTAGVEYSQASLYRPVTKSGDPRIWFSHLANYARPGNVLAVLYGDGGIYVVNASDEAIMKSGLDTRAPLGMLLARLAPKISAVAQELLDKLRLIGSRGFVPTMRPGPTGIGYTLESLLGIRANANRAPDYKGIEIKAGRTGKAGDTKSRSNLFSMAPNWKASAYSALRLLHAYGRDNEHGRQQIYCTLNHVPNSTFGFYLRPDTDVDVLDSLRGKPGGASETCDEKIFRWDLPKLRDALANKHRETFWVKAKARGNKTTEEFHYYEVDHTRGPLIGNLSPLIESGHVELDFLLNIQKTKDGKERARDHGYLFKIWASDRHLLFGPPRKYSLVVQGEGQSFAY